MQIDECPRTVQAPAAVSDDRTQPVITLVTHCEQHIQQCRRIFTAISAPIQRRHRTCKQKVCVIAEKTNALARPWRWLDKRLARDVIKSSDVASDATLPIVPLQRKWKPHRRDAVLLAASSCADAAYCYTCRTFRGLRVCLSGTLVSLAKAVEPIEIIIIIIIYILKWPKQ